MSAGGPIRVLIADDHALVRAGIASLLRSMAGFEVVGEAGDGAEALELAARLAPDVVVLDVTMKGMSGMDAAARLAAEHPRTKVIMLSMHADPAIVRQALAAGASGYLLKDAIAADLEDALRSVLRGETWLSPAITPAAAAERPGRGEGRGADRALTPRQREVLRLVAAGRGTKEIAFELGLSAKTVEAHRARIQAKLGIRDVASLVRYAIRVGISPPEG